MNYTCAKCDPTEPHPDVDFCPKCDKQSARIAELEGALRNLLTVVHDEADSVDEDGGVCVYCFAQDIDNARRVLGGQR